MGASRSLPAVFVALLAAFLYYRSTSLYQFYSNAPTRLERIDRLSNHQTRFSDSLRNCEDLYINHEEGYALLSCDPGRDEWNTVMGIFVNSRQPSGTGIYLYRYAQSPKSKPVRIETILRPSDDGEFHPLGIEYQPSTRKLFIANHISTGSRVDVFDLDLSRPKAVAVWIASIKDPKVAAPNSIAAMSDTELFITNDHHFRVREHPVLARIETYAAIPGGSIVYARLSAIGEAELHTLANLAFANGVILFNSTTLAVASCTTNLVQLYTITRADSPASIPTLTPSYAIHVPFIPDNLSLDDQGELLIAGHPHAPSIEKVAKMSRFCNQPGNETATACQLPKLTHIAEWSEKDGLRILYAGSEFGTATTAARDVKRGVGLAAGLYESGVLVWKA